MRLPNKIYCVDCPKYIFGDGEPDCINWGCDCKASQSDYCNCLSYYKYGSKCQYCKMKDLCQDITPVDLDNRIAEYEEDKAISRDYTF